MNRLTVVCGGLRLESSPSERYVLSSALSDRTYGCLFVRKSCLWIIILFHTRDLLWTLHCIMKDTYKRRMYAYSNMLTVDYVITVSMYRVYRCCFVPHCRGYVISTTSLWTVTKIGCDIALRYGTDLYGGVPPQSGSVRLPYHYAIPPKLSRYQSLEIEKSSTLMWKRTYLPTYLPVVSSLVE